MIVGIVDTTVIVHIFRKNSIAKARLAAQTNKLSVTSITWLEVMYGAPGKLGQQTCKTIRLSRGVGINDCLIASVCHRLQIPIYTHNVKDMSKLLSATQVIQPY